LQSCDASNKQKDNGVVWIYRMKNKIEGGFVSKQQNDGIVWICRDACRNESKALNKKQDNGAA
jgi:hypothetical protein